MTVCLSAVQSLQLQAKSGVNHDVVVKAGLHKTAFSMYTLALHSFTAKLPSFLCTGLFICGLEDITFLYVV